MDWRKVLMCDCLQTEHGKHQSSPPVRTELCEQVNHDHTMSAARAASTDVGRENHGIVRAAPVA